jgi:maltose alpha-D-glucosyltransferase/alpha-amylase
VNVAAQRRDPNSLLNWMERIIRMRKEVPEIGWGDFSFLRTRTPKVLAMQYEWKNNAVVCVHNLGPEPREVQFQIGVGDGEPNVLVNLLSDDHSEPDENGQHRVLMEPYGYRWYRVGGLDYLLRRKES